jgi:hypothetical protein
VSYAISQGELESVVDRWQERTLPASEWTHAAHVSVCTYLVWNNTLADAFALMKQGIYRFNEATGTPNTEARGYHETLTRFWCTLLFFEVHRGHFPSCAQAAHGMLSIYGNDSRAERPYYTFDVLASKEARRTWIAPTQRGRVAIEVFRW